jgi:hypothetical protein
VQKKKEAPVFFVRFEDLMNNKKDTLLKVFAFVMGVESLEGTYIERRIDQILESESSGTSYKPRSGKINSNE